MLLAAATDWKKHRRSNGRTSAQLRDKVFKYLRDNPDEGRSRKLTNSAWADTPRRAVEMLDGQSFRTTSGTTLVAITCTVRQQGKQRLFVVTPSFQSTFISDAGEERGQVRLPLAAADDVDLHVEMLSRVLSRRGDQTTASELLAWIANHHSRETHRPKAEGVPPDVQPVQERTDARIQAEKRKELPESSSKVSSSGDEMMLVTQIAGTLRALVDADRGIVFVAAMGAVIQLLSDAELDLSVLTDRETHRFRSQSCRNTFVDLIFLRLANAVSDALEVIVTANVGKLRFDDEGLTEARRRIAERLQVENAFTELFAEIQKLPYSRRIPEQTIETWAAIRGAHQGELLTFAQLGRDIEDHWAFIGATLMRANEDGR